MTLIVISNMTHQVDELTRLQDQVEAAGNKKNLITSLLHFRTLGLLTGDPSHDKKIEAAKEQFAGSWPSQRTKARAAKPPFSRRFEQPRPPSSRREPG